MVTVDICGGGGGGRETLSNGDHSRSVGQRVIRGGEGESRDLCWRDWTAADLLGLLAVTQ